MSCAPERQRAAAPVCGVPRPCPDRPDRARPGANPGDLRDPFGLLRSEDAPLASGCPTDPDIDMMLRDLVLASPNFLKLAVTDQRRTQMV